MPVEPDLRRRRSLPQVPLRDVFDCSIGAPAEGHVRTPAAAKTVSHRRGEYSILPAFILPARTMPQR
jgi:hypothetical protein